MDLFLTVTDGILEMHSERSSAMGLSGTYNFEPSKICNPNGELGWLKGILS